MKIMPMLYLIEILHQTTTIVLLAIVILSCILSKFYIKPQLRKRLSRSWTVVSYRNSTSNHNSVEFFDNTVVLYLIEILHQTTTQSTVDRNTAGCILSKFYIKPQHSPDNNMNLCVVSYRNSTSNHNNRQIKNDRKMLYLIEILHQTTTSLKSSWIPWGCILSKFYIKPQLRISQPFRRLCCILSKFYIKPQLVPLY